MSRFSGGLAHGVTIDMRRAPLLLRVVMDLTGRFDALDQPEDTPNRTETIVLYRLKCKPVGAHICIRGKNRAAGGWWEYGDYELAPLQPSDEILRDSAKYGEWCDANAEALIPDWAKPILDKEQDHGRVEP